MFCKLSISYYPVDKTAVASYLHYQVQLGEGINDLVQTDNVGMIQLFHAGHFVGEQPSTLLLQFGLVNDLHGYLLCGEMNGGRRWDRKREGDIWDHVG